jgi:thioredoxin 1
LEEDRGVAPSLGERLASSGNAPPRAESQRLRAWNDHRANLIELTDETFEHEVIDSPIPVIIDFWAETCGPCKLMHPVMRRLAEVFAGRAKVGRLNVYENPRTTEALEIKAIPYLVVVHKGDVVFELVGDRGFEDLRALLEPFLA